MGLALFMEVTLYYNNIVHFNIDKKVLRSIKGWNLRYFLQQVPLCTTGVHNQLDNIYLQGYLKMLYAKS